MTIEYGCFGSVLYHDAKSRRCQACPRLESCATEAAENKTKMKTWYDDMLASKSSTTRRKMAAIGPQTKDTPKRTQSRRAASVAVERKNESGASTTTLNKKPREFVERWMDKNIDFMAYKRGENGFAFSGNKFASVAMQFFMGNPHGVTREQLVDELIEQCGARGNKWGIGTAASHANIVIDAFEFLGIVHQMSGKIYLR
jgi:hypothetical protein